MPRAPGRREATARAFGPLRRAPPSVRDGGGAVLVDQRTRRESPQRERRGELSGPSVRDHSGIAPSRAGGRLEPARAPSAIEKEVVERRRRDDRGGVGTDV